MGTGRTFNKKPATRPKKNKCQRKRRDNVQRKRLLSFGIPEEKIQHMTTKQIREMLKRPVALKKKMAKA